MSSVHGLLPYTESHPHDPPLILSKEEREERLGRVVEAVAGVLPFSKEPPRHRDALLESLKPYCSPLVRVDPEVVLWHMNELGIVSLRDGLVHTPIKSGLPLPIFEHYHPRGLTVPEVCLERAKRWCLRVRMLPVLPTEQFLRMIEPMCLYSITFSPEEVLEPLLSRGIITIQSGKISYAGDQGDHKASSPLPKDRKPPSDYTAYTGAPRPPMILPTHAFFPLNPEIMYPEGVVYYYPPPFYPPPPRYS